MNQATPPPPTGEPQEVSVSNAFTRIRERLREIERIDYQSTALIVGMTDAIRDTAEARAKANLDIFALLESVSGAISERERLYQRSLSELANELSSANSEVRSLRASLDELESRLLQALARLADEPADAPRDPPDAPPTAAARQLRIAIDAVPNAVTGLGIQRFLEGLSGVEKVTARSFSNAELQFDLHCVASAIALDLERDSDRALESQAALDGELRYRLVTPGIFVSLK